MHLGYNVDPVGLSRGFCLWWKPDVTIQVLSATKNLLDTFVRSATEGCSIKCSYFYRPPHMEDKTLFWSAVMNIGRGVNELLCGSVNQL